MIILDIYRPALLVSRTPFCRTGNEEVEEYGMRLKRPYVACLDQVRISREDDARSIAAAVSHQ